MTPEQNPASEIMQTVFVLRHEVRYVPHREGKRLYYVVEDPLNSKYYRIGQQEYDLISRLDGKRTLAEAWTALQESRPDSKLNELDTQSIGNWLLQTELATRKSETQASMNMFMSRAMQTRQSLWSRFNPISIKLPLLRPDRTFDALAPMLSWIFTPQVMGVWCCVVLLALATLWQQFGTFASQTNGILALDNWLWLAISWVLLKVIHETAHGLACKKFGGSVREAGVMLILFAPLAYVDVSSSSRFRSRWHRMTTALAGIYAELFVAAIAMLIWANTEVGLLKHVCHNVVTMASITTLLFNANPLMRFDGYYVLTDLLRIPNLYTSGQGYVHHLGKRVLLGLPSTQPKRSRSHDWIVKSYGIASLCWRMIVSASLILGASTMFEGAGIALSIVAVILWFGMPAFKLFKSFRGPALGPRPNWLRCAAIVAGLAVPIAIVLLKAPWPAPARAPAIVEYSPLVIVRAASPGFVEEVRVTSGQFVDAGTVLARLGNPSIQADLADLKLELEQSKLRSRSYASNGQLAAYQAEREQRQALEKRCAEKQEQVDALLLTAPSSGRLIGRQLDTLLGTYLKEGDEFASIGSSHKELRLAIPQNDVDFFAARVGQPVRLRLPGLRPMTCTLMRVEPRASLRPPHAALCASSGGPLPVRAVGTDGDQQVELTSPRFTGTVSLPDNQADRVTAGQVGVVGLGWNGRAIGPHLYRVVTDWMRAKMGTTRI